MRNRLKILIFWTIFPSIVLGVYTLTRDSASAALASYGVFVDWGTDFIVKNGKLATISDMPDGGLYTSGINNSLQDTFPRILFAVYSLLTGETETRTRIPLLIQFPWVGLIMLPVMYSLWFLRLNVKPRLIYPLLFFSALPTSVLIGQFSNGFHGGVLAVGITLLLLYIMTFKLGKNVETQMSWTVAYYILFVILLFTYHTYVLYFLFLFAGRFLVARILRESSFSLTTLYLHLTGFLASLIYINIMFFNSYTNLARKFLEGLKGEVAIVGLETLQTDLVSYLNVANVIFIAFLLLMFLLHLVKPEKISTASYKEVRFSILYFFVGLIPLAGALFLWRGFSGMYGRLSLIGGILTPIIAAYVIGNSYSWRRSFSVYLVTATTIVAVTSYLLSDISRSNYLSVQEMRQQRFIASSTSPEALIFTDFRMGPGFAYYDHFNVGGIQSQSRPREETLELTNNLLYDCSAASQTNSLKEKLRNPDILFLSSYMFEVRFVDESNLFPAMEHSCYDLLLTNPQYSLVSNDGSTYALSRFN